MAGTLGRVEHSMPVDPALKLEFNGGGTAQRQWSYLDEGNVPGIWST